MEDAKKKMPETVDSLDKTLTTANFSILVGYFFVFQINLTTEVTRWLLLISFVLYVLSMMLMIWHYLRYPRRIKIFNDLREKTLSKFTGGLADLIQEVLVPLHRLKARVETQERIESAKSKAELTEIKKQIAAEIKELEEGKGKEDTKVEKATEFVVDSILNHMHQNSINDYKKAFNTPLDEKYSKFKFKIDWLSIRIRKHVFVSSTIILIFSIIIHLKCLYHIPDRYLMFLIRKKLKKVFKAAIE